MRVCVVAEYYPRRRDPVSGIWAHRQAIAAREAGAAVRVLALERPLPGVEATRAALHGSTGGLLGELRRFAAQPRREIRDGIEVEYVRFPAPPRERGYAGWHRWARAPLAWALERARREHGIDLVHAHYATPSGAAARAWTGPRRMPLVVSVHGGDVFAPTLAAPAARSLVGATLRGSDVVLCNSAATLRRAARLAGRGDHMRVVHLGADPLDAPDGRRPAPTLATVAHLIPRKRHEDVLRALAVVDAAVRWLVIGDGPELPRLRALAADLGIDGRVEWAGRLEHERARAELARCDLMVMPSVDEAFGVAYVEALASGVPAVGCAGEGGPEEIAAICPGMTLVRPRDPGALAAAVERLLVDRAELAALGTRARAAAAERFSWAACGRATVAAYGDALDARR